MQKLKFPGFLTFLMQCQLSGKAPEGEFGALFDFPASRSRHLLQDPGQPGHENLQSIKEQRYTAQNILQDRRSLNNSWQTAQGYG